MFLNTLQPAPGSKTPAKRLGRGIGSGKGKTCGKGHKGQKARSGGYHKVGFEGGQMPLQRRIPKSGFKSKKAPFRQEVRLSDIDKIPATDINLLTLVTYNLIKHSTKVVKIIAFGTIERAVTIKGLLVTKGAKSAIEAAGGTIEE